MAYRLSRTRHRASAPGRLTRGRRLAEIPRPASTRRSRSEPSATAVPSSPMTADSPRRCARSEATAPRLGDVAMRLGLTGRLDTLQAAVLLVGLRSSRNGSPRAGDHSPIPTGLQRCGGTPPQSALLCSAWALYAVRTRDRDNVRGRLSAAGVETGLFLACLSIAILPSRAG